MMYAVGQGALAVECLAEDSKTLQLLSVLHHRETALQIIAERSFLYSLGGGCSAPVGVVSFLEDNGSTLELEGGVWSLNGEKMLIKKLSCSLQNEKEVEPPRYIFIFKTLLCLLLCFILSYFFLHFHAYNCLILSLQKKICSFTASHLLWCC